MTGIYHSRDHDGYCSGAIMKLRYPDIKLIGYDYGQELPMDQIPEGEPIIMADVSMPMEKMEQLARHSGWQLTWIDHHKSAIQDFMDWNASLGVPYDDSFCKPYLFVGKSACELCWEYFFPKVEMPEAVLLLGMYDTWRNKDIVKWEEEILPFQFGARLELATVERVYDFLTSSQANQRGRVNYIIASGKTILAYQREQNARACRSSFEAEFEGLRAICLNGGGFNSDVFKSVYDESRHDIMMPFAWNGKRWTFSLYTTKPDVDCSELAKKRGGGGHKQAAGFQATDLKEVFKK